jgi:hypothetical protein
VRELSERTKLEMERGRKMVEFRQHAEEVAKARSAGVQVTPDMPIEQIKMNVLLAEEMGRIKDDDRFYPCKVCGGQHKKGERCPDVLASIALMKLGQR